MARSNAQNDNQQVRKIDVSKLTTDELRTLCVQLNAENNDLTHKLRIQISRANRFRDRLYPGDTPKQEELPNISPLEAAMRQKYKEYHPDRDDPTPDQLVAFMINEEEPA